MFACCIPKSGGCRLRKAHPANTSPRWGCGVRAPRRLWPFDRKDRKKTMDETERRLLDTPSISLSEEVSSESSPGAGVGDHQGRPLTPPRPLSLVVHYWTVVHEPKAGPPSEELEPAPSSWAAAEGGVVPAATSAGDQEPADDLAPAHGEPEAVQEEPAGEPAHREPAPAPATAPALTPLAGELKREPPPSLELRGIRVGPGSSSGAGAAAESPPETTRPGSALGHSSRTQERLSPSAHFMDDTTGDSDGNGCTEMMATGRGQTKGPASPSPRAPRGSVLSCYTGTSA
ncbi:skin secretory protein xP2-like [Ursus americanus]|uniref:skin secretory protein xP2-like n=1 Tax=Ursus americanus TaxID=9643 RepID=UPI001E67B9FE|nr:skin secretory protein xP2-like [Ursus americanus]